jgi:iron complex outermembrane receptor protein
MRGIRKQFSCAAIALAVSSTFGAPAGRAAETLDVQLEDIVVSGAKPSTAAYEAPTQATLDAGEPQSVISQRFIENNAVPNANYTDIINIAPSVVDTTPNGRGNAESLNLSIRGFQDGQFNVTFDGIPWNDSNDFTHHSTSYFTADTIGNVLVDRGPGTASQVGNATFGGTIALQSKDPMQSHNVTPSLTLGSFHTDVYSLEVDSGVLPQAGNGRAMLTLTSINTDGAMTNNGLERKNAFFKYVLPVSADTTVTAVAMYNTLHQNVAQQGTIQSQLNQFGPNYSLSDNPSSDSYYGFNFDDIHTDFEYVDVKTVWDGWHLDNKTYTYAYYHKINKTNDTSLALGSEGAIGGTNFPANDVAGQKGYNNYRSWGDIARFAHDLGPGTARFGLWADYQWNDRALWDVDWSQGGIIDTSQDTLGFQRLMHDTLTTLAPFLEYEYRPIEALTVTPGLRYTSFARSLDATVNQKSELPLSYSHTWAAAQPSVYGNYRLAPNWSVYAQYARGFLAPNLNLLYRTSTAAASALNPQLTDNLQAGTTWKNDAVTLGLDVYHIKFNNFFSTSKSGTQIVVNNGGGAVFKGEEFEGTVVVGAGVSIYGNASHNDATYDDGTPVQNAPSGTAALGLIYDHGPLYASIISKHVGSTVQQGGATNTIYNVSGYTVNDLALVYRVRDPGAGARSVKICLGIDNLSNNRAEYYTYGGNLAGTADAWMTLPGRAYSVGISADF